MPGMSTPTVTESPLRLESIADDPFVADLDPRSAETDLRVAAYLDRVGRAPRRRIFD